jgi:biopolymer transport protein ExbD
MAGKVGGSGGGSRYTVNQNADINVTPFVDIMLVLLIIFMVSIPTATVSIKLDLPPAVPPKDQVEKPKDPVFISIQGENEYYIAERKTSMATLIADLNAALQSPDPRNERVLVRAQADVKYEEFIKILNQLQSNGYYKIGLINEDIE